jgi:hypothetical protein
MKLVIRSLVTIENTHFYFISYICLVIMAAAAGDKLWVAFKDLGIVNKPGVGSVCCKNCNRVCCHKCGAWDVAKCDQCFGKKGVAASFTPVQFIPGVLKCKKCGCDRNAHTFIEKND